MRLIKILAVLVLLAVPVVAAAKNASIPDSAVWYFHIDLEEMRSNGPGKQVYSWLQGEAFEEVSEESGFDVDKELDRLTAFSMEGDGPVLLFEGKFSQETKDKIMTFVASDGDLTPKKSSGKTYYYFSGGEEGESIQAANGNVEIDMESLGNEAWVSMALRNKVVVTGSEEQMQAMLANNGKVPGSNGHKGALLVLTAEKTLLQAGMQSNAIGDDSDWDSNILQNTEQVAFLMAAAANKLALEATLITTEPEMAESLASVVRGLVSLAAFNDDIDPQAVAMLQGTRVEASGNSLSISLAIDPDLVVQTLSD
jgi:hypothetical protein